MTYALSKALFFLLLSVLLSTACESPSQALSSDDTPPTVEIYLPKDGTVVSGIITLLCVVSDNEGVERVELWIDGKSTGVVDTSAPYDLDWNTVEYEHGASYTIFVRAYDVNGNTADSDPIILTVDNSPTRVELKAVIYHDNSFFISWPPSPDDNFASYRLYEVLSEELGSQSLIYETGAKPDTVYIVSGIASGERRSYRLEVENTLGITTPSNIMTGSAYQKIVFVRRILDKDNYIYLMDIDGNNQTIVTSGVGSNSIPQFSPDGMKIVFSSWNTGAFAMDLAGNKTILSELGKNPQFFPDGSKIFFQLDQGGRWITVIDADGGNLTILTPNLEYAGEPQISLDGSKIVFKAYVGDNYEIFIMDADGNNQKRLTNDPGKDEVPRFSSDGRKIVFLSSRDLNNTRYTHVFIMDADGSNQINLTPDLDSAYDPQFSPDGQKIIYGRPGGIHLMDIDGGNKIKLSPDMIEAANPAFSQDGSKIVFYGGDWINTSIYTMDAIGDNLVKLTGHSSYRDASPHFQPRP